MNYFEEFLMQWGEKNPKSKESMHKSSMEFVEKIVAEFSYKNQLKALLLGHVQSGKTSQMLATISALADKGFKLFLLLTSDMTNLQEQTLKRAFRFLPSDFIVCSETDSMRFREGSLRRPTIVVLKKNSRVLRSWKRELASLPDSQYAPMVILDDEADSASLNTKVNQKDVSAINALLDGIGKIPPSSIYIQVTATPQAVLLQTKKSGWKPEFIHAFEPSTGYYGGKVFYGEDSRSITSVPEQETKTLLESNEIPPGLKKALFVFIINAIYILDVQGKEVCNFLIHPGAKIDHHNIASQKISRLLNAIKEEVRIGSEFLRLNFFEAYEDIKGTCSDLPEFDFFWMRLLATTERVKTGILNSHTPMEIQYDKGIHILIGGNATGRGITFPGLQVVYYCRESKVPQADTLWQHSRIFGYDRVLETCRIFLPIKLLQIFRRLNEANDAMFKMILENELDQVAVLEADGVKPTRKNVLDQEALISIVGDTNYIVSGVVHTCTQAIDAILGTQNKEEEMALEEATSLLELLETEEDSDRQDLAYYLSCLKILGSLGEKSCYLIVRTDRDIAKETGTLLSPNDRQKGAGITDKAVLTLYRINGQIEKGWDGHPVWIPNVKFPKGRCFYITI